MTPKTFNPVDVVAALGKLVLAVVDTKVLAVAHINQTIIATPSVRVDDAFKLYFAADNRL